MDQRLQRCAGRSLAALSLCLASAPAVAAGPAGQFSVTGAVSTAHSYNLAGLQAFTPITQIDSFGSGSGQQTHTYSGASLWGVLGASGIVVDPLVKNDVLNKYVLATGSDGYKVVFSAGELSPDFGNRA